MFGFFCFGNFSYLFKRVTAIVKRSCDFSQLVKIISFQIFLNSNFAYEPTFGNFQIFSFTANSLIFAF